jgi:glycosyltransferase involved in cell wall biosynthesis
MPTCSRCRFALAGLVLRSYHFLAMNILLACNRFFLSGGPERYLFNILPELETRGHDLAIFALDYKDNISTPHRRFFPPAPVGEDFIRYGDKSLTWRQKAILARQVIFDRSVYHAAIRVIQEKEIDVIYALQIAHYLFPELFIAAKKLGTPVVWRQSDFQILCPAYNSLRNGKPCSLCDNSLFPALIHRCVKASLPMTGVRVASMIHARLRALDRYPSRIICPTRFVMTRLSDIGFPSDKLVHLPTPIPDARFSPDETAQSDEKIVLFVGGLYEPKGAHVVVKAAMRKPWSLIIAGDFSTPYGAMLKNSVEHSKAQNIHFAGHANDQELAALYQRARMVVIPSLWDENLPHTLLEARAAGVPVIASDTKSMREFISHEENGLLFSPGDAKALALQIERLMDDDDMARKLREASLADLSIKHSMNTHLDHLENIFEQVIG